MKSKIFKLAAVLMLICMLTGCADLHKTQKIETLDDLNNANDVMTQLLNIDWYRGLIQGKQMVMIGYSDSAKDAGVMAASWAQYQAQDALIKTCEKAGMMHDIKQIFTYLHTFEEKSTQLTFF